MCSARESRLSLQTPIREVNDVSAALIEAAQDRKRFEEHQALMLRELHHRVKNTLATVQALVNSTARTTDSIDKFRTTIEDRITSLARTHTMLVNIAWGGAHLRDILRSELEPYETDRDRFALNGPEIIVPDNVALGLGMAAHELTTNAAKCGALSLLSGVIVVDWITEETQAGPNLILTWTERGGPPVKTPSRRGFGSKLLERALARQLSGKVDIDFRPDGLQVVIRCTLASEVPAAHRRELVAAKY